jgi:putative phosphoesterase
MDHRMAKRKKSRKIALLSDVHGNLPALEAVLADAADSGAGELWNLGDFVGYAPFPNKVIQVLRDVAAVNVVGNYDLKVLAFEQKKGKWREKKAREKYIAFEWNHRQLSNEGKKFLESLPEQRRCKVDGLVALLVHGSPASVDELLGSDTTNTRFQELAKLASADLVVCGHSHEAFVRWAEGTWFVNPGSVGRPEGGDWRASYALIEIVKGVPKVEHRRIAYDIERVARGVHAAGLPDAFIDVFRKAKSLDQLRGETAETKRSKTSSKSERCKVLDAVMALARSCDYEREHTHQVTKLALELFDELRDLHKMGAQERFWLRCGALLHDIGWTEGQQGHHKTALRLIIGEPGLPWERREREIVGLIARYHRKALPSAGHKYFPNLNARDQQRVRVLGGILRVADGLDRTHADVVRGVTCQVRKRSISVVCEVSGPAELELAAARKKADLMQQVFEREVRIAVRTGSKAAERVGR